MSYRLTSSQLEGSFKLYPQQIKNALLTKQFITDSPRAYTFTSTVDGTKTALFQPVTVDSLEEMGLPSIEDALKMYEKTLRKEGISQILIPLAQVTPIFSTLTSRHFLTLKLDVDPKSGNIIHGKTIDSKSYYGTLKTREEDIERILKNAISTKNFTYAGRTYLAVQPILNDHDCGIHTHLVCKSLIEDKHAPLNYDSVGMKNNIGTIVRNEVKNVKMDSITEGPFGQIIQSSSPITHEPQIKQFGKMEIHEEDEFIEVKPNQELDDDEFVEVNPDGDLEEEFVEIPTTQPSGTALRHAFASTSSKQNPERNLMFADGQSLADSVFINLDSPEVKVEIQPANKTVDISEACMMAKAHHPDLKMQTRAWMVEEGNRILQKLYETKPTSSITTKEKAKSLLNDFGIAELSKRSGIYESAGYKKLSHMNELASYASASSWLRTLNRAVRGDEELANARRDYLFGILCAMWSIYNQAALQGEEFERGSFKIVDPDGKLFQLLKGYVQYATGQENPGLTSSNFAYKRDPKHKASSQYKDSSFKSEQYGIDMRLKGDESTLDILPSANSHLLFGQIDIEGKKYTFLKFEPIGLGSVLEFIERGTHSLHSGHTQGTERREKDIPGELKNTIYPEFQKLYTNMTNKSISAETIAQMYQQIATMKDTNSQFAKIYSDFNAELVKLKLSDFVQIRTGNEVILNYDTRNVLDDIEQSNAYSDLKNHESILSEDLIKDIEKCIISFIDTKYQASLFQKTIDNLRKSTKKYEGIKSLADDLSKISFSEFVKIAAGGKSRDQLVIDAVNTYNENPEVLNAINAYTALINLNFCKDKINSLMRAKGANLNQEEISQLLPGSVEIYKNVYANALFTNLYKLKDPKLNALARNVEKELEQKEQVKQKPKRP